MKNMTIKARGHAGFMLLSAVLACSDPEAAPPSGQPGARPETEAHEAGEESHEEGRVELSEQAWGVAGIRTELVSVNPEADFANLEVPGQVEIDPRRVALVSARTPSRIETLAVVEGDHVRRGEVIATLFSTAYITAQQDFLLADRRARSLAGTQDEQGAVALRSAARRRLALLGASEEAIRALENGGEPENFLTVRAPFSGSVMESEVIVGASIEAGTPLVTLADLSVVDVVAEVPERALPLVSNRQPASVAIAAYPDMRFDGQVERLREELNPETRTVQAVIHVPNRGGRLRPGMFASVRLSVDASSTVAARTGVTADSLLTIPARAVLTGDGQRIAFVEVGERTYERRVVEITSLTPPGSVSPSEDRVVVHRGLAAGERVVVDGAFTLKSELAKAELGEHGH
jgi:RND family efflux transporter MFP subunit